MPIATNFTPNTTNANALPQPYDTYSASGAITAGHGVVYLTGNSALAMTLANPSTAINGAVLMIVSTGTGAHTVTNTTGFNGAGSSGDVATWTGAAGNAMIVTAYEGVWYTLSLRNVALG